MPARPRRPHIFVHPVTRHVVLLFVSLALSQLSVAQAASCEVNTERAYQEAQKRGWTFRCLAMKPIPGDSASAAITFDRNKRLGCSGRTGKVPGFEYWFNVQLFRNNAGSVNALRNGWSVDYYHISGGSYSQSEPFQTARVAFTWKHPKTDSRSSRYIEKLVFKKEGGNCSQVYAEAFGS